MKHSAIMAAMVLATTLAAAAAGGGTSTSPAGSHTREPRLVDAAPSVDVLLQRFLDALARRDAAAINRLRVSEQEYRTVVIPGGVESGQPPRTIDDDSSKFYWDMLNTKSLYAEAAILKNHGGRRYRLKEVQFLKGQRSYAWYEVYRTASLKLEDDAGDIHELTLGSIANVDGQYKFIGMLGDT